MTEFHNMMKKNRRLCFVCLLILPQGDLLVALSLSSKAATAEMASAPAVLLEQLTAATQVNDFSQITELIDTLRETHPAAADALAAYAELLTFLRQFQPEQSDDEK